MRLVSNTRPCLRRTEGGAACGRGLLHLRGGQLEGLLLLCLALANNKMGISTVEKTRKERVVMIVHCWRKARPVI